jgi:hypothetical protein
VIVLNCYRLAKFYGRNPDEFLGLPLSEIGHHMMWTDRLIETLTPQTSPDGD